MKKKRHPLLPNKSKETGSLGKKSTHNYCRGNKNRKPPEERVLCWKIPCRAKTYTTKKRNTRDTTTSTQDKILGNAKALVKFQNCFEHYDLFTVAKMIKRTQW
jgi:hypothetical protein